MGGERPGLRDRDRGLGDSRVRLSDFDTSIDPNTSMIVYCIENKVNGKRYVGQTSTTMKKRFVRSRKYNRHLRRAFLKYGTENFRLSILSRCRSVKRLNVMEQQWIRKYKTMDRPHGYNLQLGGMNRKMNDETKVILSKKCSGWHHTEDAKRRISKAFSGSNHHFYGKKLSPAHVEKLRKSHVGYVMRPETREKLRSINKNRKITWGDKIAKANTKARKADVVRLIRGNPEILYHEVFEYFGYKTCQSIGKICGGWKKLRKEAIGYSETICPICKKKFKQLTNTHLLSAHGIKGGIENACVLP